MTQVDIFGQEHTQTGNIKSQVYSVLDAHPELADCNKVSMILMQLAKKWKMGVVDNGETITIRKPDFLELLRCGEKVGRYVRDYNDGVRG